MFEREKYRVQSQEKSDFHSKLRQVYHSPTDHRGAQTSNQDLLKKDVEHLWYSSVRKCSASPGTQFVLQIHDFLAEFFLQRNRTSSWAVTLKDPLALADPSHPTLANLPPPSASPAPRPLDLPPSTPLDLPPSTSLDLPPSTSLDLPPLTSLVLPPSTSLVLPPSPPASPFCFLVAEMAPLMLAPCLTQV